MITTGSNNYPADHSHRYTSIETAAARARLMMGLDVDVPLPPTVWLLEEKLTYHPPMIVGGQEIPVVWEAKPTPHNVEADTRFDPEHDQLVVRVDVTAYDQVRKGTAGPRPRFAICHEIGHVHLHAPELVRMSAMPERKVALLRHNARQLPVYRNAEWQAEAFGGALLMPAAGLDQLERKHGRLNVAMLVRFWDVSIAAAEARLRVWRAHPELKEVVDSIRRQNRRATVPAVAQ